MGFIVPATYTILANQPPLLIAAQDPWSTAVLANVGGLDAAHLLPGPTDILLTFGDTQATTSDSVVFVLLSGWAISLPLVDNVYASARSKGAVSVAIASGAPQFGSP